jgi:hypothetical protein
MTGSPGIRNGECYRIKYADYPLGDWDYLNLRNVNCKTKKELLRDIMSALQAL